VQVSYNDGEDGVQNGRNMADRSEVNDDANYPRIGIDRMSPEDCLNLIGESWDGLDDDQSEIPEIHRRELDRRLDEADANPAAGLPWEEVRAQFGGKLK
jgi:putative addiction module component (TIGR02574 family)